MSDDRSTRLAVPSGLRALLGVLVAVFLVAGVGLLFAGVAGFSEVREAIERADPSWFAVCLVAQVLALSAYASVVRGALGWGGRQDPGIGVSAHVMLASIGATRVFLAGGAGALAVTYWCFRRARFTADEAIARVLGLNVLFYVAFAVGVWAAALVVASGRVGDVPVGLTAPWLALVPLLGAGALIVTRPQRAARRVRESSSLPRRVVEWAVSGLAWTRELLSSPAGPRMLVATLLYWVGNVACLWASLQSVGEGLPLPELVLAFAAGHAAMILPLPLGGAGGVDAALSYALIAVGVPLATAIVAVGVYRLFAFWAPTVPAIAALLTVRRAGSRLGQLGAVHP